jgi:dihydropteroate synthase
VVLDPGFGFGKLAEANYALLAGFGELRRLGYPVLAGLSRKGFLAAPRLDGVPEDRLPGTLAANTAAVLAGAHVLRVHDVRAAVRAAGVADAILAAAVATS